MSDKVNIVTVHKARQSKEGYLILILPELAYGISKETQEQSEMNDAKAIMAALKDSIAYSVFDKLQDLFAQEGKM